MRHKKLQKLCYYAQAWYITLFNKELIDTKFEAWVHGPVSPILWDKYSNTGWELINLEEEANVSPEIDSFLEDVWATYGHLDGQQLESLTHQESPWVLARAGLGQWDRSNAEVTLESMRDYYGQLYKSSQGD